MGTGTDENVENIGQVLVNRVIGQMDLDLNSVRPSAAP
jgi:hypothetical protein